MQSDFYGQELELCAICYQRLLNDFEEAKKIIVVRSPQVGGHRTVQTLCNISTRIEYEDFDDAKFELQYNAYKLGGNAVLNYKYIKHKHSKSTGHKGEGTYYYNLFTAKGTIALVER